MNETFVLVDSTSIVIIAFLPVIHVALAKLYYHMQTILKNILSALIKEIQLMFKSMFRRRLFSRVK